MCLWYMFSTNRSGMETGFGACTARNNLEHLMGKTKSKRWFSVSRRRRRNNGKGYAIAILTMAMLIVVLLIAIVVVLIRGNTGNPLNHAKVATADYTDVSGNTGQRAYISVNKNALTKVTEKQFASFYEKTVSGSEYALFTIACDDGTGIVFLSSPQSNADGTTTIATYGYLNENGEVTESFGQILLDGGKYKYQAQ